MDLANYSEEKFNQIKDEISYLVEKSSYKNQKITFIPISALHGENVVNASSKMPWYKGESLLEHLENLQVEDIQEQSLVRFPIQTVIRPKTEEYHDFRGYAGKIYGGNLQVGDSVTILPSSTQSKIKTIHFFDKEFVKAESGSSVTITLEDDVNISRGDMLVKTGEEPKIEKQVTATVCWMDKTPLQNSNKYYIQHGVKPRLARLTSTGM